MAKIDLGGHIEKSTEIPWSQRLSELLNRDFQLFGSKTLSDSDKETFYSDLHVLVSSGLDLRSALELMVEEGGNEKTRNVLASVKKGVFAGRPLSSVLMDSEGFSEYEVHTLKIGEETGSLAVVLADLAKDYSDRIRLKRELISAFSYPVMVTVIAFGAVTFMLVFVVPIFTDFFSRMGRELPWLTRQVIGFSDALVANWWLVFLAIVGAVLPIVIWREKDWFKDYRDRLLLRIPILGDILKASKLARFTGSMAFMLGTNVNLLRSMNLAADITEFSPIIKAVGQIEKGLIRGESITDLMRSSPIFDPRFVAMVKVGEEVNRLGEVFQHMSGQYSEQVQRKTKLLSTFIEPIMIGFLGVLVGIILVSMYLPLFQMNSAF